VTGVQTCALPISACEIVRHARRWSAYRLFRFRPCAACDLFDHKRCRNSWAVQYRAVKQNVNRTGTPCVCLNRGFPMRQIFWSLAWLMLATCAFAGNSQATGAPIGRPLSSGARVRMDLPVGEYVITGSKTEKI